MSHRAKKASLSSSYLDDPILWAFYIISIIPVGRTPWSVPDTRKCLRERERSKREGGSSLFSHVPAPSLIPMYATSPCSGGGWMKKKFTLPFPQAARVCSTPARSRLKPDDVRRMCQSFASIERRRQHPEQVLSFFRTLKRNNFFRRAPLT